MRAGSNWMFLVTALAGVFTLACSGSSSTSPTGGATAIPGLVSTGVNVTGGLDTVWEVECTNINASTPACPVPLFQRASRVNSTGFGWIAPPSGGSWIGATDSASLPTGQSDSAERYQYIYRMQFDLTGYDPSTAKLSLEWAADNYFGGYRFNAGSFIGGGSADQQWLAYKTLTLQSPTDNFVAGRNLLEFRVIGDGVTDGFVIRNFTGTAVRK